jgi:hypothetical protein
MEMKVQSRLALIERFRGPRGGDIKGERMSDVEGDRFEGIERFLHDEESGRTIAIANITFINVNVTFDSTIERYNASEISLHQHYTQRQLLCKRSELSHELREP